MIAIRGFSSSLVQHLIPFMPPNEEIIMNERGACHIEADRHLFAQGLISPKRMQEMSAIERADSFYANAAMTIEQCNKIIACNDMARICVIGSESGFAWSYDDAYAASKAALHRYVETKKLRTPHQQLICIAPSIIGDSRMTRQRKDTANLRERELSHPKQRFLTMSEVCRVIHFALYIDNGYLTNTVIRMNGGQHL